MWLYRSRIISRLAQQNGSLCSRHPRLVTWAASCASSSMSCIISLSRGLLHVKTRASFMLKSMLSKATLPRSPLDLVAARGSCTDGYVVLAPSTAGDRCEDWGEVEEVSYR